MTAGRLIWGMTWRGGVWSMLAGLVLGGIYSTLFWTYAFSAGLIPLSSNTLSAPSAATVGIIIAVILLGVIGGIFSAIIGLLLGLLGGVLCAFLSRAFFLPIHSIRTFRWTVALIGSVYGLISTFVGIFVSLLLLGSALRSFTASAGASSSTATPNAAAMLPLLLGLLIIPPLVAAIAAVFIAQFSTGWYIGKMKEQNAMAE